MEVSRPGLFLFFLVGSLVVVDGQTPDIQLRVTAIGRHTIAVTWNDIASMNYTKYQIQYTSGASGQERNINVTATAGTKPTKILENLVPGTPYDVVIWGTKAGAVESRLGSVIQYTRPEPPTNPYYYQPNGTKNIVVMWGAPQSGSVNKYIISYEENGSRNHTAVDGRDNTYTYANLTEGTTLKVVSMASGVGTNLDAIRLIQSRPVEVERNGTTDFYPTVGAGATLAPMFVLTVGTVLVALTGSYFI